MSGRPTIAWSFSALNTFENCPRKYWAVKLKKLVSDYNQANTDGDIAHKAFDANMSKGAPLPAHLTAQQPIIDRVKAMPGQIYPEYSMALDADYVPCKGTDWNRVWVRSVADVLVVDNRLATVIDWKFGKVPKRAPDPLQMEIVSATVMRWFPAVEEIRTRYIFPLGQEIFPYNFTRAADEARIWNDLLPRVRKLEQAKLKDEWPATPNPLCAWCAYGSCPFNTNPDAQNP